MPVALTLEEVKERLAYTHDLFEIVERLDITYEELIDRFEDKVLEQFDELSRELSDWDEEPE
jgi:tRNA 2-selenouridine synthase SelU